MHKDIDNLLPCRHQAYSPPGAPLLQLVYGKDLAPHNLPSKESKYGGELA